MNAMHSRGNHVMPLPSSMYNAQARCDDSRSDSAGMISQVCVVGESELSAKHPERQAGKPHEFHNTFTDHHTNTTTSNAHNSAAAEAQATAAFLNPPLGHAVCDEGRVDVPASGPRREPSRELDGDTTQGSLRGTTSESCQARGDRAFSQTQGVEESQPGKEGRLDPLPSAFRWRM